MRYLDIRSNEVFEAFVFNGPNSVPATLRSFEREFGSVEKDGGFDSSAILKNAQPGDIIIFGVRESFFGDSFGWDFLKLHADHYQKLADDAEITRPALSDDDSSAIIGRIIPVESKSESTLPILRYRDLKYGGEYPGVVYTRATRDQLPEELRNSAAFEDAENDGDELQDGMTIIWGPCDCGYREPHIEGMNILEKVPDQYERILDA